MLIAAAFVCPVSPCGAPLPDVNVEQAPLQAIVRRPTIKKPGYKRSYMSSTKFVTTLACGILTAGCSDLGTPQQVETQERIDNQAKADLPNVVVPAFGLDILWRCVPTAPTTSCGVIAPGAVAVWHDASAAHITFPGILGFTSQIAGVGDFNGDGTSDILWRDNLGNSTIWPGATSPGFPIAPVGTNFSVVGVGDFDGNGKSDILWRDQTAPLGPIVIWNDTVAPGHEIGRLDLTWFVAGVGDFNGDGVSDILWRSTQGPIVIWSGVAPGAQIGSLDNTWNVAGIGDFDGDGTSDILWRSGSTNVIWPGGVPVGFQIGSLDTGWQVVGVADFDRNGKSDILWRHANGENALWLDGQVSQTVFLSSFDVTWQVAGVGKFAP